jgi:hypothetical protein
MVNINRKVAGVQVNILDNEITEFDANCAIDLANKIYEQVRKEHSNIMDTSTLRALTIFKVVLELQTIKGNQEVILDTNTKRMRELIKLVESIDSPI